MPGVDSERGFVMEPSKLEVCEPDVSKRNELASQDSGNAEQEDLEAVGALETAPAVAEAFSAEPEDADESAVGVEGLSVKDDEGAGEAPASFDEPVPGPAVRRCKKCGCVLGEGMNFCGKCGADNTPVVGDLDAGTEGDDGESSPVSNDEPADDAAPLSPIDAEDAQGASPANPVPSELAQAEGDEKAAEPKKPSKKTLVIASAALFCIILAGTLIIPDLVATPKQLFEQQKYDQAFGKANDEERGELLGLLIENGDFSSAYEYANDAEKTDVLAANLASHISADIVNSLKDPSSYTLREVWIEGEFVVLKVGGTNSFGGQVNNYWLYDYQDDGSYDCLTAISDLEEETISRFDTKSEIEQKLIDNEVRTAIRIFISKSEDEVSSTAVNWTNLLFSNKGFDDVELLDEVSSLHSDAGSSSTES